MYKKSGSQKGRPLCLAKPLAMGDRRDDRAGGNSTQYVVAVNVLPAMARRWRFQVAFGPVAHLRALTAIFFRWRAPLTEFLRQRLSALVRMGFVLSFARRVSLRVILLRILNRERAIRLPGKGALPHPLSVGGKA